jgi:hypothetical protein
MKLSTLKQSAAAFFACFGLCAGAFPSMAAPFRPSVFKVTFYEIGLRDSTTGERNPVFQNPSGTQVDLSNATTLNLISGSRPQSGTWDQLYVLIGNSLTLAGTDGNGCFIQAGATDTDTDGTFEIVTNNPALSGQGTTTESSFGGSFGPNTPAVATSVNGTAVTSLRQYLVSSTNPVPGGGGTINRFLFIGNLGAAVTTTDSNTGTISYSVDASQALDIAAGCASVNYANTKFNMSVQQ